jgi:hypothetical protein
MPDDPTTTAASSAAGSAYVSRPLSVSLTLSWLSASMSSAFLLTSSSGSDFSTIYYGREASSSTSSPARRRSSSAPSTLCNAALAVVGPAPARRRPPIRQSRVRLPFLPFRPARSQRLSRHLYFLRSPLLPPNAYRTHWAQQLNDTDWVSRSFPFSERQLVKARLIGYASEDRSLRTLREALTEMRRSGGPWARAVNRSRWV